MDWCSFCMLLSKFMIEQATGYRGKGLRLNQGYNIVPDHYFYRQKGQRND